MNLHTASEVISLARKLETESARFYEDLAREYAGVKEIFQSFAKENTRNIVQIERTYYGVISDAIEGGYAFDMNPDTYTIETTLSHIITRDLEEAIKLEEKMVRFYSDAATQSKSLLADVPRSFAIIAMKRADRILRLRSLIEEEKH